MRNLHRKTKTIFISLLPLTLSRMAKQPASQKSDDRTFESLFRYYYPGLIVYANRFTQQQAVSEDMVHDVFLGFWEKMPALRAGVAKTYLFNATRNSCLNYLRQLKTRSHFQEQVLEKGEIVGLLTWENFVKSELEEYLDKAIATLPPQRQRIFIMNRFEGKTAVQIAEELDLSPRTVQKHLELALKSLRAELSEYLPASLILLLLSGNI